MNTRVLFNSLILFLVFCSISSKSINIDFNYKDYDIEKQYELYDRVLSDNIIPYGYIQGGWYSNLYYYMKHYTYECSGVPGSTDC